MEQNRAGVVLPTSLKGVVKIAVPTFFALLGQQLLQQVDTAVLGRLGPEELAAGGVGAGVFVTLTVVGIGFLSGLDYWIPFEMGRNNESGAKSFRNNGVLLALFLGVFFGIVLVGLGLSVPWWGLGPGVSEKLRWYLFSLAPGLVPALVGIVFTRYLQSIGKTTFPVIGMILCNILNFALNLIFVLGAGRGFEHGTVVEAGICTALARLGLALILGLEIARVEQDLFKKFRWQKDQFFELCKLGLPASLQMGLEVGAFALSGYLATTLGVLSGAAHQAVIGLGAVFFMLPLGLSISASILMGTAFGKQDYLSASRIGSVCLKLAVLIASINSTVLYFGGSFLIGLYTKDFSVIETGIQILKVVIFFQLFDALQAVASGLFRGMGNSKTPFVWNLLGHWCFGIPLALLLTRHFGLGLIGIWYGLALGLFVVAAGLLFHWRKIQKSWLDPSALL